jgi:hypothetical protein
MQSKETFTDVSEERPASISESKTKPTSKNAAKLMKKEAIHSFNTSVNFYQTTRRNIPEDGDFHSHRCENLKSLTANGCSSSERGLLFKIPNK